MFDRAKFDQILFDGQGEVTSSVKVEKSLKYSVLTDTKIERIDLHGNPSSSNPENS